MRGCRKPRLTSTPFFSSMLAEKLNMSTDDAEKWIVNLIRNARLDAKIDAKEVRLFDKTKAHSR